MPTVKRFSGRDEVLSDEIYRITHNPTFLTDDYQVGCLVRKISGVDDGEIPGYHFSHGYTTVCRVDARIAEYVGIKTKYLKLVGTLP